MDSHTGAFSIVGSIVASLTISVLMVWRKIGTFVTKDELKEDIKQEANHRITVNMDLLQRMTAVETKVDMGFKMLSDKMDKNGK